MGVQALTFSICANSASMASIHATHSSPLKASFRDGSSSLNAKAFSISPANSLPSTSTPPLSNSFPFVFINSLTSSGSSTLAIAALLRDVGAH